MIPVKSSQFEMYFVIGGLFSANAVFDKQNAGNPYYGNWFYIMHNYNGL